MASVELEISGTKEQFLVFSTVKLDRNIEKAQYRSCLYFLQITPEGKLECVCVIQQRRVISCMQSYRGKLLSVQKSKQDFEIVIQSLKLNPSYI